MTPEELEKAVNAALEAATQASERTKELRPDRLTKFNTGITIVTGLATAVVGIFLRLGQDKIQQDVDEIRKREQIEASSYKFAELFLTRVITDKKLDQNKKTTQAVLSIVNIVAQASSSKSGFSDPTAREILPIHLALILGEPGAVAALDPEGKHIKDWVNLASVDNETATRVTAIRALTQLGEKALMSPNGLAALKNSVDGINQLIKFIPESGTDAAVQLYRDALAARSQLGLFVSSHDKELEELRLPSGSAENAMAIRADIRKAFSDIAKAVAGAPKTRQEVQKQLRDIEGIDEKSVENSRAQELQQTLDKLDVVIASASDIAVKNAGSLPQDESSSQDESMDVSTTTSSQTVGARKRAEDLLKDLNAADDVKQQTIFTELALLGTYALKPLLAKANLSPKTVEEEKNNLRVAIALSQLRQPVHMDPEDGKKLGALLKIDTVEGGDSKVGLKTRRNVSEFLMDLGDAPSILNVRKELNSVFEDGYKTHKEGAVFSAALVVGTWARNLVPRILAEDGKKPMRDECLETVRSWRDQLKTKKGKGTEGWATTLRTLNDLIARAENVRRKTSNG